MVTRGGVTLIPPRQRLNFGGTDAQLAWRDSRVRGFQRGNGHTRCRTSARSRKSLTGTDDLGIQSQENLSGSSHRRFGNHGGGRILAPEQRHPIAHRHQVVFRFARSGFRDAQLRLEASIRCGNQAGQRRSDRLVAAVWLGLARRGVRTDRKCDCCSCRDCCDSARCETG